jgi:SAM-dependent methyltransferase
LHLELLEAALLEGMVIKDSTPYNIQFRSAKPVFIDIPSFEPLRAGSVWGGYKQFCEMFLFPLMLKAYRGLEFQPLMRSRIDGVDIASAASLFAKSDWLKRGVFSHVWLQSLMHGRHLRSKTDVGEELKAAGFNEQLILANVRKLKRLVQGLEWKNAETQWGDYEGFHNYSQRDVEAKERFVENCLSTAQPSTTWDIGCNTGRFSRLAERHSGQVIAMDIDHLAIERLYQTEKGRNESRINPILQNIADPSPNWGWRNRERTDLLGRSRPDFVLCLALIHHIVISANIPLEEFVRWLADVTSGLIIEFVSRNDDKVRTLLLNKEDIYTDYSQQELERCLEEHFRIKDSLRLESGNRYLYFCKRNESRFFGFRP